jgi:predicted nucleic acid-binding Zn ribbon protein
VEAGTKGSSAEAVEMGSQGRSRKGPQHIGTILDSFFRQQGIEEPIRVHRAVVDWDSIVGDAVSRHGRAVHIEHGTLIVEVESPGWMHRLQMQELELRSRINRHFGEDIIRQIRFRLGSTSPPATGPGQENQEE